MTPAELQELRERCEAALELVKQIRRLEVIRAELRGMNCGLCAVYVGRDIQLRRGWLERCLWGISPRVARMTVDEISADAKQLLKAASS